MDAKAQRRFFLGNWKMEDGLINRKLRAVLRHGLTPVLCVGSMLTKAPPDG
jgi:triosephosphate isomerase